MAACLDTRLVGLKVVAMASDRVDTMVSWRVVESVALKDL